MHTVTRHGDTRGKCGTDVGIFRGPRVCLIVQPLLGRGEVFLMFMYNFWAGVVLYVAVWVSGLLTTHVVRAKARRVFDVKTTNRHQ